MADKTNKTTPPPPDDGVRPARFGLKTVIVAVVLAVTTTVFALKVINRGDRGSPAPETQTSTPPAKPEPVPTPPVAPPPPAPPSIHPMEGTHHILSAPAGRWRHASLSWTDNLNEAGYPIATIEKDDPCFWELVGVEGRRDVYRIINRSGSKWSGAHLSYTHFEKQDFPFATVEKNDPGLWKVTPLKSDPMRYKIVCYDDSEWHASELSWEGGHDLSADYPIASVENDDPTSWLIIPEDQSAPIPPAKVTHVIIYPRADIADDDLDTLKKWAPDIIKHIAKDGNETLTLKIGVYDGEKVSTSHAGTTFQDAAEHLRKTADPVAELLPGSLSLSRSAISGLVADAGGDDRKLDPFPLVLPVTESGTVDVRNIETLLFEDKGFFRNKLEKVTHFQSHLDESPTAAGRVFHGTDYFTYVFVNLTPTP